MRKIRRAIARHKNKKLYRAIKAGKHIDMYNSVIY